MRKNLFLTLALSLAAFAGINAQDWTLTLSANEGLPGYPTVKNGVNVTMYKSGIITPTKPIKSLRFTVTETKSGAKPEGSEYVFFALSELNVLTTSGKELEYKATSNADHNKLAKDNDGQGILALQDGDYDNFFHSLWEKEAAAELTEAHYIELEFAQPLESFILEWGARYNNDKDAPMTVGLTEAGKKYVPLSDYTYKCGDQITTASTLGQAKYITLKGNAATKYDQYDNATGELTAENTGKPGVGPLYTIYGNGAASVAETPSAKFAIELVPVNGAENTYKLYFPFMKAWLSGKSEDNGFSPNDGKSGGHGWQHSTTNKNNAAEVKFTPSSKGNFEMSYVLDHKGEDIEVYIGADPRSGVMRIFDATKKNELVANGWAKNCFGIKLAFDWSLFNTEYSSPAGSAYYAISKLHTDAMYIKEEFGAGKIDDAITKAKSYMNADVTEAQITEVKKLINTFLKSALTDLYLGYRDEFDTKYKTKLSDTPKDGCYPQSAWDEYLDKNILAKLQEYIKLSEQYENLYSIKTSLNNIPAQIKKFEASVYNIKPLPREITDWSKPIIVPEAVNGIRLTFLENKGGGKWNNYPMIDLKELEIIDNTGTKVVLTADNVTSNCVEESEGSLAGLFDGTGEGSTFYHSIWSTGTMDPEGYVYLDIQFPEGTSLSEFTIKLTERSSHLHPTKIGLSKSGEKYEYVAKDPLLDRPNTYNVKAGAQIDDPAKLKDGGIYIISGNLRVNKTENAATARYYSGNIPYSDNIKAAANDTCVYMFKKVGDESWNIINLSHGMFWDKEAGMTAYQQEAAVVKFVKSGNLDKTMVIYSEINKQDTAKWEHKNEEKGIDINIPESPVTQTALVYMDWDDGLAVRPCVSPIPGEFTYGLDALKAYPELINESSAGDYLHFNKTNGEGEWNITEVTMDTPYYLWLTGILKTTENIDIVLGDDPGCVIMDEAVYSRYNKALANAQAAVEAGNKENAKAIAEELSASIAALAGLEKVAIDPAKEYRIDSDIKKFLQATKSYMAIYIDEEEKEARWGAAPKTYIDENLEYIFKFKPVKEETEDEDILASIPEDLLENAYYIYNAATDLYIAGTYELTNNEGNSYVAGIEAVKNVERAVPYIVKSIKANSFLIYKATINEEGKVQTQQIHANGHNSGWSTGGSLIYYNTNSPNSASAWTIKTFDEDLKNSVNDVVVEGDEVVAVSIYTPAGVSSSKLENGVNIVVKVYANGVVETEKVIVK